MIIVGAIFAAENEKIIQVPSEMTVEMILANESGVINGTENVRARIFDTSTLERLWYENYANQPLVNGSVVLKLNSIPSFNAYALHKKNLKFVVSVGSQAVEIPLLTSMYAYRTVFSEYGYDTRFPSIFYIDRTTNFLGFGTQTPKAHLDVVGAMKIAFEDTNVTGSIRWQSNSLYIKHPSRWVDLLYGPSTFIKSRWSDFSQNIQLTSSNYRIGVGTKFPQQTLQVAGTGYFSGSLTAGSVAGKSMKINEFIFNDTQLKPSAIYLRDGVKVMEWTQDNLRVPYGVISGNGSGLTNVGQEQKDFSAQLIQSHHLDTNAIASKNLKLQAIESRHLIDDSLTIDRMISGIFNSNNIGNNSIASKNIQLESLTFDMLITNNVTEYVPDALFIAAKIAPNSVFEAQLKDLSIASVDVKSAIFDHTYFTNNIVLGNVHLLPKSLTYQKIATGEVKHSLFSGVLNFSQGGTAISSLYNDRVLVMGTNQFNSNTNLYINSANNVGIFGSTNLNSLQKNFPYPLTVGSLTTSVNVAIRDSAANKVQVDVKIPNQTMSLSLNTNGKLSLDMGSKQLILHETLTMSTNPSNTQERFDLGSAITIGDATNSEPNGGTMEYEAANQRFRFYNGSIWKLITHHGLGVGNPISYEHHLKHRDSFIGSSQSAVGHVQGSFIGDVIRSNVVGSQLHLSKLSDSNVSAERSFAHLVASSTITSDSFRALAIVESDINVHGGQFDVVTHSYLKGQHLIGSSIRDSSADIQSGYLGHVSHLNGRGSNVHLNQLSQVQMDAHDSVIDHASFLSIQGQRHAIQHIEHGVIRGVGHVVIGASDVDVRGRYNVVHHSNNVSLNGHDNIMMSANEGTIEGDHNRSLGEGQFIHGQNNVAVGPKVYIDGNHNIAFNASDKPLKLSGDRQVLFNAPNGLSFHTGDGMVVSALDAAGWAVVSDRELKTNFLPVNHQTIFEQLMALPVSKWEYNFSRGVKHIGPMAQDFKSSFRVGEDERFITSSDADGVAFSAIKYLFNSIDTMSQARQVRPVRDLSQLEAVIDDVHQVMNALDNSIKLKKQALEVMVDNNLEQYQMIDQQLKLLASLKKSPSMLQSVLVFCGVIGVFLMSLLLGFYLARRYHNKKGV